MKDGIHRRALLVMLALLFTAGLTFTTLELPYWVDKVLQSSFHTPDIDSHVDAVSRLKTDLFMAHYHVRAIGYVSFSLLLALIVLGFSTRWTGLATLGAFGVMLATFAQFAGVMFFLAGLGILNAVWLPVLDLSYGLQDWGLVIEAPDDFLRWVLGLFGVRSPWPTIVFFTGAGVLLFLLGVFAWLTARTKDRGIADFWVYRISRHPQYLGWILWTYGAYLLIQLLRYPKRSWGIGASLPWLLSTMVILGVALMEELNMRNRHGDSYEAYRRSAPFLLPLPHFVQRLFGAPVRVLFGKDQPSRRREVAALVGVWTAILMGLSVLFYAGGLTTTITRFRSPEDRGMLVAGMATELRTEEDHRRRYELATNLVKFGEQATDSLTALLTSEDPTLRSLAGEALGTLRSPAAVRDLCAALTDPVPEVRYWAGVALESTASDRSIDCLMGAFSDPSANYRSQALRTLARLGVQDVLVFARQFLSDPSFRTRADGVRALGALGSETAIPMLEPMLEDENASVRREAVIALLRIGSPLPRRALERSLTDPDFEVRIYAGEALKRLPSS